MKKFIVMILSVTTFFLGLGSLVSQVGAKFKSDAQALELIKQARQAIGGDANIKNVRSLTIIGKATQTSTVDGVPGTEQGDMEINLSLPNQYGKMMKFGDEIGGGMIKRDANVVIFNRSDDKELSGKVSSEDGGNKIFIRKVGEDNKFTVTSDKSVSVTAVNGNEKTAGNDMVFDTIVADDRGDFRQNDLFHTTFSLLLTAPEGLDVSYVYAGEGNVDGFSCDIVDAQSNGSSVKLYLDKSSHLPRMMTYQAVKPFMIKIAGNEMKPDGDKNARVLLRQKMPAPETSEFQVKFSDYRAVNGIQLPFKWTQTVGGQADQNVDIVSYEVNPANIADKFQNQKIFLRTEKPQQ